MEVKLIVENFTERIDEFDRKIRERLHELVSWSYSYETKELVLELTDIKMREEEYKEVVLSCL